MRGSTEAALKEISPERFLDYLEKRGWRKQVSEDPRAIIWSRWNAITGDEVKLLLPMDRALGDYELRVEEAIEVLSDFEGRPQRTVVDELITSQKNQRVFLGIPESVRKKALLDMLVGAWGLDVFGLECLSRRAIWELRSAACVLTLIATAVTVLSSILLGMVLGSYGCLSFGLALPIAFTEAIHSRQILTAPFLSKSFGPYLSAATHLIVVLSLGLILSQGLAMMIFRDPIEKELQNQKSIQATELDDFFSKLLALNRILESDTREGHRTFKLVYLLVLIVSVGTLLLPFTLRISYSRELRAYFSFDHPELRDQITALDSKEADSEVRGVSPSPGAPPDGSRRR